MSLSGVVREEAYMSWDGVERRSDDHAARIASLETYSRVHAGSLEELKADLRAVRACVQSTSQDLHAAKVSGKVVIAVAVTVGGMIGWVVNLIGRG